MSKKVKWCGLEFLKDALESSNEKKIVMQNKVVRFENDSQFGEVKVTNWVDENKTEHIVVEYPTITVALPKQQIPDDGC